MNKRPLLLALLLVSGCEGAPERFQGYVEGEPVQVSAPIAGELLEITVQEGQQVAAGAALFTLEAGRESASVAEAEHRLDAARARLADLRKGKRTEEIKVIRAQLAQAQAQAELARTDLARQRDLYAKEAVSKAALDAAVSNERNAAARVAEFQATLKAAELAARADTLRAAEQEVQAAEAALEQVRWNLERKAARAPAAGLVEQVYYRRGEWIAAGAPVLAILPPENRVLRFYVPEPVLGGLQVGQALRVHCDGCAAAMNAQVRFISPRAEFTPPVIYSNERRERLLFMVEAAPVAADALKLKPGQPIDVELVR